MDLDLVSLNDWLARFINFERSPDKNMLNLATMRKLCDYYDHPEQSCPCFHIGGSKGKGTISSNIAGILSAAGYKVGIYTSPHVYHFTERVCSAEGPFPKDLYYSVETTLKEGVSNLINQGIVSVDTLTWFELVTIFAMLVFKAAKVDYAVYEVGMGGRLDTTNIVRPVCISMGPIELEHTEYLGNTLTDIATEKAGIFKPHTPIISAPQSEVVKEVFHSVASVNSAPITYVAPGEYQIVDARVAELSVRAVLPEISSSVVQTGLNKITLPARYEIIQKLSNYSLPYVLIDGAHTVNSIKVVIERMKREGVHGNLLFGCVAGKKVKEMAKTILNSGIFDEIYLTKPGSFKESDLGQISKAFSPSQKIKLVSPDYEDVIKKALSSSSRTNTPLIVLGSFYLAGEVRKLI